MPTGIKGALAKDAPIELRREYYREYYRLNKERCREYMDRYRQKIRAWFKEYKSTLSCEICEENHPACIEFHHIDGKKDKYQAISMMICRAHSKERIMAEVAKCRVLCSNCHRKYHHNEGNPACKKNPQQGLSEYIEGLE